MDDYYASILNASDSVANEPSQRSLVAIFLSRRSESPDDHSSALSSASNNTTCRISVVARIPRKRSDQNDPIKFTLQYFSFLDERRRFTNLDALLTRLAPIGSIHLACTENSTEAQLGSGKKADKRNKEVSDLISKLSEVIDSRDDIFSDDNTTAAIVESIPKQLSSQSIAHFVDSSLVPLLGGDSDERVVAYKGDRALMNDILTKRAIGLLLHIHKLDSEVGSSGAYELSSGHLTSHLFLDRTAVESINLLPKKHLGVVSVEIGGTESNNSIFGVLNHCKTKMGVRMLEMWLRQPLIDVDKIMYRQDAVRQMVENDGLGRDRLREGLAVLSGVDLDALCAKLSGMLNHEEVLMGGSTRALECLYRLHLFADSQLPMLVEALSSMVANRCDAANSDTKASPGALSSSFFRLQSSVQELSRLAQLVEAVLDFQAAPRTFLVNTSFSEELADLRTELDSVNSELEDLHAEINAIWSKVSGSGPGQVRLESTDTSGNTDSCAWQFRLPDTNAAKILQDGELKDLVTVHRVLKNGVYFSTKALRQLGTRKHDILSEYEKHQKGIVQNAVIVAVTYVPILEKVSSIVAEVDVLASLAHAAAFSAHGYCRPEITDGESDGLGIELSQARHPCVELQDDVSYIANDISLVYGSSSFLIVTGPNCGGKSTYIRSLGAIVTMAQIGSYVPCTAAKINIVHHILARVGAGDLQDRGISTFMAEMLEASSILRVATKRSLIIIDELGRGTSTFDGYGLATAISEYIIQRIGCFTIFATHFHELTELEDTEKVVKNCHVTAQRSTDGTKGLTFLYEVRQGPCLQSFGIQVAEMANFPSKVIADAKRKARHLENFNYQKRSKTLQNEQIEVVQPYDDEVAAALAFVHQFKCLPLDSLEDPQIKREMVLSLLKPSKAINT